MIAIILQSISFFMDSGLLLMFRFGSACQGRARGVPRCHLKPRFFVIPIYGIPVVTAVNTSCGGRQWTLVDVSVWKCLAREGGGEG